MSITELGHKLFYDLKDLKLPVDEVVIYLRPYSKTYYGRYFPTYDMDALPKIFIYPYENTQGDLMCYTVILKTAIHELCHHLQYINPDFVRSKGVMHNTEFWKLYNFYVSKAIKLNMIGGDGV